MVEHRYLTPITHQKYVGGKRIFIIIAVIAVALMPIGVGSFKYNYAYSMETKGAPDAFYLSLLHVIVSPILFIAVKALARTQTKKYALVFAFGATFILALAISYLVLHPHILYQLDPYQA
jgi:hypothetical protein